MATDFPSKSEVWGTFYTLSDRLDDLDTHVVAALVGAHSTTTKAVGDSPYAVVALDYMIRCDASGGDMTIDLPAATGSGRILNIKKIDSSSNIVTISGAGADTIDGETSREISIQYASLQIQDGAAGEWDIT